ncbi:hypothetical protein EST38_g1968 [Candolleomyces aberdarensis]|uniref:ZW10 C-terminal helical domain-containing protein n=1 Tax=Candolleomyces aberdarensis TaxID=2316362 RepID=A0A4Q2DXZ1_9AGAR|nr:hypothetical protein EST38_g1968 [Candolleomyces aberdarensis]
MRIHERIQQDLPKFHHQFETSKSVQVRLHRLTEEVEALDDTISNPQSGLVPKTLQTLKAHAALSQAATDASVTADSLAHLLKCRQHYTSVMSLVQFGKLPEAVAASIDLDGLVGSSPEALQQAVIMKDMKRKIQALKSNIEGQLLDALSRSVIIQPTAMTIQLQVQVRDTEAMVTLDQILASLSSVALGDYLSVLKRDFVANFVDRVLQQPYSLKLDDSLTQHFLTLVPSPPSSEQRISRLENLSSIFDFVAQYLFPHLPSSHASPFLRSLSKPVVTSILNLYLIPQLPSSFGLLPPFLELVQACVDFEARYVVNLLNHESPAHTLKDWSDGLSGHYERQRRTAILARSRELLVEKIDLTATFQVDVARPLDSSYPIAVNGAEDEEDAWGFQDESSLNTSQTDSWGFDDDAEPETEDQPQAVEVKEPVKAEPINGTSEEDIDTDDAWGWNDDEKANENAQTEEVPPPQEESPTEEPSWDDDPWADPPSQEETPTDETNWDDDPWGDPSPADIEPAPVPPPKPATTPTPKAATRLERLASKNKKQANGNSLQHSIASPPPPLSLSQPNSAKTISSPQQTVLPRSPNPPLNSSNHHRRPSKIFVTAPTETYRVTSKTKQIVKFVEDVVAESKQFAASNLFTKSSKSPTSTSTSTPGSTLIQCSSSVLDLYQALCPVRFEKELSTIGGGLQFSNDCLYLSDSVDKIEREASHHPQLKERLGECRNDLKILGDSWFEDAVNRECLRGDQILVDGTQRFAFTGDQERYDECEEAINKVVRNIKDLARKIQPILTKTKYYQAVGRLVDAALSRVLHDIIALPDIPELESTRLAELCRIFNSLEGLFSEDPTQSSFVVAYVPSWLKFSYLSELLEASMADLSYLFEQGALVDFEIRELVNLVRALFADTQLRTNTINKLQEGHPVPTSA